MYLSTLSRDSESSLNKLGKALDFEQNVGNNERMISVALGGVMVLLSQNRSWKTFLPLSALGGALALRGLSGHCSLYKQLGMSTSDEHNHPTGPSGPRIHSPIKAQKTVTVDADADRLYKFWRDPINLPKFIKGLKSVEQVDEKTWRWEVLRADGEGQQWVSSLHEDVPGRIISWRSLPDEPLANDGSVSFFPGPKGRGTEVRLVVRYEAPGGKLGQMLAGVLGGDPFNKLGEDLRCFKQLIEAGEIPTTQDQPVGAQASSQS